MDKDNKNTENPTPAYSSDFSSDLKWRSDDVEPAVQSKPEIDTLGEKSAFTVKPEKKRSGLRSAKWLFDRKESFIMRMIDKAVVSLYDKTKNGAVGHFFTSYAKTERAVSTSATFSLLGRISEFFKKRRNAGVKEQTVIDDMTGEVVATVRDPASKKRPIIKSIVSTVENSAIIRAVKRFIATLFYLPMSTYGALLLSLGITTILVQAVKVFLFSADLSMSSVAVGVAYTLVSMLTIFSGDVSFARYVCDSRLGSFLLTSVFGISKKTLDLSRSVKKYRFWAFLAGVSLGLLSIAFSASGIFVSVVVAVFALGVATNPESGIVLITFVLPFTKVVSGGENYLCIAVLYTVFVWLIKVLGGKRRISFGALELWLSLFAVFILVTGLVSADKTEAFRHATLLISALLGFFAASNLLSQRAWFRKEINAILLSGFAVSVFAVYEWITGAASVSWNIAEMLTVNVTSVFANADILSLYLVIVFFFALSGMTSHEKKGGKFFSFVVTVTSLGGILFTSNVYAWVTVVSIIVVYSLIKSKKNAASVFGLLVIILLAVSTVSEILPSTFVGVTDTGIAERFEVMRTAAQMSGQYLVSGIGLGESVFENVYASLSGVDGVHSSDGGSLITELMIRFGFMGIVFIASAAILSYRQAFSTLKLSANDNYAQKWTVAAICSLSGALMISLVSYIWSDTSMALMFWIVMGLVSATRKMALFENTGTSHESGPSIDLPISSFRRKKNS